MHVEGSAHTAINRQYRLAAMVLGVGVLALGMLALNRLAQLYAADGAPLVSTHESTEHARALGYASLTVGQWLVAVLALIGVIIFVAGERRRLARVSRCSQRCTRNGYGATFVQMRWRERCDLVVRRGAIHAGLLMSLYLLQESFVERVSGGGWALQNLSLLPLLSLIGLASAVGIFVAAISTFGLRVVAVLEVLARLVDSAFRVAGRITPQPWRRRHEDTRTLRDRFGDAVLSRPPPAVGVMIPTA